jgi:predicted RNA methylase
MPDNYVAARDALRNLTASGLNYSAPQISKDQEIRQKEREIALTQIDGFFPSPPEVIARMLDIARLHLESPGLMLEPSAGAGHIADAVRERYPAQTVHCVELAQELRALLELKGHQLVGRNIYDYDPKDAGHAQRDIYDVVLMNPPFEHLQDIDHVQEVFIHLLKPAGRLVSVMSISWTFNKAHKADEFRQWVEQLGGYWELLPEDAFQKSDRPTGVRTGLLVLDKTENANDQWRHHRSLAATPLMIPVREPGGALAYETFGEDADQVRSALGLPEDNAEFVTVSEAQLQNLQNKISFSIFRHQGVEQRQRVNPISPERAEFLEAAASSDLNALREAARKLREKV